MTNPLEIQPLELLGDVQLEAKDKKEIAKFIATTWQTLKNETQYFYDS